MTYTDQQRDAMLAQFGLWCLREMRHDGGCDIDGGAAQDEAYRVGLLERVTVTEPCGELCYCAENDEFPQDCVRFIACIPDEPI